MDIVIDLTPIFMFFELPVDVMVWRSFIYFGWIPIVIWFLIEAKKLWLQYIIIKYSNAKVKYTFLAIDIPRGNEQTPKAVENMFTYLGGAHSSIDLFEKYWVGKYQLSFSYEIVSIDGYIQFIIRTPSQFRNLIESSVYSQYPDAEISEIDDYTTGMPTKFPDEEYDIWGAEFVQARNKYYPMKTYEQFEHQLGPSESYFKDPMASLMDLASSLKKGEQLWFQMLVTPIGFDWMDGGEEEVDKILNKINRKESFIIKIVRWLGNASEVLFSIWGEISDTVEDESKSMIELTPRDKKRIEAIHDKVSKLGFEAKIRMVYIAKKDVKNAAKVVNGFVGYMKQFAALDLNNLKPDITYTMTSTSYFNQSRRLLLKKNRIMTNYINRDTSRGRRKGLFNIEELATLWHFPVEGSANVAALGKVSGKKVGAPISLPLSEGSSLEDELQVNPELEFISKPKEENIFDIENMSEDENDAPPSNLPIT